MAKHCSPDSDPSVCLLDRDYTLCSGDHTMWSVDWSVFNDRNVFVLLYTECSNPEGSRSSEAVGKHSQDKRTSV